MIEFFRRAAGWYIRRPTHINVPRVVHAYRRLVALPEDASSFVRALATIRFSLHFVGSMRWRIVALSILSAGQAALTYATAVLVGRTFESGTNDDTDGAFIMLSLFFLAWYTQFMLGIFRTAIGTVILARAGQALQNVISNRMYMVKWSVIAIKTTAAVAEAVHSTAMAARDQANVWLSSVPSYLMIAAALVYFLFNTLVQAGTPIWVIVLSLAVVAVVAQIPLLLSRGQRQLTIAMRAAREGVTDLSRKHAATLKSIKLLGIEHRSFQELSHNRQFFASTNVAQVVLRALLTGVSQTFITCLLMGFVGFGLWYGTDRMTLPPFGELGAMAFALFRLLGTFTQLSTEVATARNLSISLERTGWLLDAPREPYFVGERYTASDAPMVECKNVTYAYPNVALAQGSSDPGTAKYGVLGQSVLQDFNLTIEPGQHLLIAGESGSGKSTLLTLVTRLLSPQSGEIWVGGKPITDWELRSYRQSMDYILQDVPIMNETVRDAIFRGSPPHIRNNDDLMWKALHFAALDQVIRNIPQQAETYLHEFSKAFSGGQMQRLALANCFVRQRSLVILDEPTSALDPTTEAKVISNLVAEKRDSTMIVVSHRVAIGALLDRVIVMSEGTIVEDGTFAELVEKDGEFNRMLRASRD